MISVPKLVGACLARNEAGKDRYWRRVLANAKAFCDTVLVLDDGSTDATASIARELGCVVHERGGDGWWGGAEAQSEAPARKELWERACELAGADGWLYLFDADHELLGIAPSELRALLRSSVVDSWACPLWDCWESGELHRVDGPWQAWRLPRPWIFRALTGDFGTRAIHVGHAPFRDWTPGLLPSGAGIRHWSYVTRNARLRKLQQYLTLQQPGGSAWTPSSPPQKQRTPKASATRT